MKKQQRYTLLACLTLFLTGRLWSSSEELFEGLRGFLTQNSRFFLKCGLGAAGLYGVQKMYQQDRFYLKTGLDKLRYGAHRVKRTIYHHNLHKDLGAAAVAGATFLGAEAFLESYGMKRSMRVSAAIAAASSMFTYLRTPNEFEKSLVFVNSNITLDQVKGEKPREIWEIYQQLQYPELAAEQGIQFTNGVLLYGLPGTGKTYLAKGLAGSLGGVPFISMGATKLMDKYYGGTEGNIAALFEKARRAAYLHEKKMAIIFIDEIDAVGKERTANEGVLNVSNPLQAFLTEMDGISKDEYGVHVIVIAATNKPEVLDKALVRAGRFDTKIEIGLPGRDKRKELFAFCAQQYLKPLVGTDAEKDALFTELAQYTDGKSPADIEAFIKQVNRRSFSDHVIDLGDNPGDRSKIHPRPISCEYVRQRAAAYFGMPSRQEHMYGEVPFYGS